MKRRYRVSKNEDGTYKLEVLEVMMQKDWYTPIPSGTAEAIMEYIEIHRKELIGTYEPEAKNAIEVDNIELIQPK